MGKKKRGGKKKKQNHAAHHTSHTRKIKKHFVKVATKDEVAFVRDLVFGGRYYSVGDDNEPGC